ncbi:MAG: alpha/beta hydrolase, partial [Myxococcota bacterium]
SLETLARDVLDLAEHVVGNAPVPIVGHSMGGRVALKARMLARERVSAVTLLDIGPGPIGSRANDLEPVVQALTGAPRHAESKNEMREHLLGTGIGRALTDWLLMNLVAAETGGVTWQIERESLVALQAAARDEALWEGLEGPTLCVRGGRSPFVDESELTAMAEHGTVVHTLERAGHFLHMDAPDELLQILVSDQTTRVDISS